MSTSANPPPNSGSGPATAEVIEKVRKLLDRQVGKGCTEAESQTAFAMASRLLAEHNLTMDEVENAQREVTEDWTDVDIASIKRRSVVDSCAARICEDFFFVESFWRCVTGKPSKLIFFGKPSNIETARWVYHSLCAVFDALWLRHKMLNMLPQRYKGSYVKGLEIGFSEKLKAERAAMEQEVREGHATVTGTALAVIANKVTLAFQEAYPKMGTSRAPGTHHSREALRAGREHGRQINLARPLGGGEQKKLGGSTR